MIFSAPLIYVWNNVYAYDIDFHLHMADNPDRNWGIILQQAGTLHMKKKLGSNNNGRGQSFSNNNSSMNTGEGQKKGNGKNCWKYNRGKCTYSFGCKFEHRCGICNKYGHGTHICRKGGMQPQSQSDRDKDRSDRNGGNSNGYYKENCKRK